MPGCADTTNLDRSAAKRTVEKTLVVFLLLFYFFLALSGAWNKSPAVDEVSHATAGVSYWRTGDFRLNSEQGKFPQSWAALPIALGPFKFPSLDQEAWWHSDEWTLGRQFFFGWGNDVQSLLRRGRSMVAILGVALGLIVYLWSRRLFGMAGGIVSLIAYAFSPIMLAHGGLMTSDLALALALTAAVGAWWIVLHRITPTTVLGSAAATALVFVTKASAVILIPILLILFLIRLIKGEALALCVRGRVREVESRWKQTFLFFGVGLVHVAVVILVIWACFGFRFLPFKHAEPGRDRYGESWEELLVHKSTATHLIAWARDHRLLPDGYLWGLAEARLNAESRRAFLAGHYSLHGWRHFFPFSFLVKTPLAFLGLLGLALLMGVCRCCDRLSDKAPSGAEKRLEFYELTPLLVLSICYGCALLLTRLNIGHRHMLALYPTLFILAGAAGLWFQETGIRQRVGRAAVGLLLAASVITGLWVWPNYLAYFNLASGGSANGYRLLVDSSLDWGQELPALNRWLDRNGENETGTPVYLAYFGVGAPDYYGIRAQIIPKTFVSDLSKLTGYSGGIYCVSATMLQAVYLTPMGKWCRQYESDYQAGLAWLREVQSIAPQVSEQNKEVLRERLKLLEELEFARLAAFLRHRKPDGQVNCSILIYRLTDEEIRQALFGPPAELYDTNEVRR